MNQMTKSLELLARGFMEILADEIESYRREARVGGRTTAGSWSNDHGVVVGYLSYWPQDRKDDDTIDAMTRFAVTEQGIEFSIDICKSTGNVIAEISKGELKAESAADSLFSAYIFMEAARDKLLEHLKRALLSPG